jgi:hypothetical protein
MNLVRLQRSINSIRRDLSVLEGLSRDIMEEMLYMDSVWCRLGFRDFHFFLTKIELGVK